MELELTKKEPPKILIVDDISVNLKILEHIISQEGYEPLCALNVQEAIDIMKESLPELILSDLSMPEMDGLEATNAIRAMNRQDAKTIPIIALTANAFDEDVQRSMQAGLNAHLTKPVEAESLFGTLESLIKG